MLFEVGVAIGDEVSSWSPSPNGSGMFKLDNHISRIFPSKFFQPIRVSFSDIRVKWKPDDISASSLQDFVTMCPVCLQPAVAHPRLSLVLLVSVCVHANFVVEQPHGSGDVFPLHPRLSWFMNRVCRAPCLPCMRPLRHALLRPWPTRA